MTLEKTEGLLDLATDILLELIEYADEKQRSKIESICNEMKWSDRIDDEMKLWEENDG